MSGLPPGTQDTGLAALMGGGFAPPLGTPIPLHQPASAPPAPTDPMAAVLAPVRDRVSSGESGGSDPYHETYGGGHFGWQGVPNTGSGKYGFVKSTWDETVKDMLAAQGGPVPDFNNPHDQDRVFDFKATKTYGIDSKGRNLAQASKAGDVEYDRLAQVWPSLAPQGGGPKNWFTGPDAVRLGMTEAFQKQQALDQQHLATMHEEMAAIQKQMSEVNPDSQEYRKLLRQQIDASQAIEARYLQMAQNPPTRTMPDLFSGFGSLALLVAAIGGRHSRQPATASLNAAAGALQGIQQNNQQQFEDSFKTWQAQTQALNNALTAQNDVFRNILENEHLDENQRMEKLNEAFKLFDMSEASFALEHGMLDKAMQFPQTLSNLQLETDLKVAQIGYLHAHAKQVESVATGGALLDQSTLTEMADQYLSGDKSVLTGLGYGNLGAANRAALREEIQKRARDAGMSGRDIATALAEYSGLTAGERSLGTRTAQMGMAVSEAKKLIPQVLQTSAAVDRTKYPTLNSVLLAAEKGTGDEHVVRLGIAINSFINVYARAISPTGTPTVSDKDHARELLEGYWSQGQIVAGMDQITKELEAASQAPGTVRQEFRESGQTGVSQPQIGIASVPSITAEGATPQTGVVIQNGWRYDAKTHQPIGPVQ